MLLPLIGDKTIAKKSKGNSPIFHDQKIIFVTYHNGTQQLFYVSLEENVVDCLIGNLNPC
jgi:hypothetical protein